MTSRLKRVINKSDDKPDSFRKFLEVKCSKTGLSGSFALKLLNNDENNITQFLDNKQLASGGRSFYIPEDIKTKCLNYYETYIDSKELTYKEKYYQNRRN